MLIIENIKINLSAPHKYKRRDLLIVFIVGVGTSIYVDAFGVFTLGEIVTMLIFPYTILKNKFWKVDYKYFYLSLIIWLISAVISDIYNETILESRLKGIATPSMILLNFIFFVTFLTNNSKLYSTYFLGLIISGILHLLFQPLEHRYYFFYNILPILLPLLYYYSCKKNVSYKIVTCSLLMLGILCFINEVRSAGVIFIISGTFFYLKSHTKFFESLNFFKIIKVTLLLILVIFTYKSFYNYLGNNNLLSEYSQIKFEQQAQSENLTIFEGRKEILGAIFAIIDEPIIGHGSKPVNSSYWYLIYDFLGKEMDIYTASIAEEQTIPAHSILLNVWLEHGIFATFFPVYIFFCIFRLFWHTINSKIFFLTTFIIYFFFNFCWDFIFSPMGAERRVFIALVSTIYLTICKNENRFIIKR